jgi:hypothetical protein
MGLPLVVAVKNFLGLYVLTPFEESLLAKLSEALNSQGREILAHQLAHFTTVRRLMRHLDEPNAHGYTEFYTLRFGKNLTAERQVKRFPSNESQAVLATAHVVFNSGEIDVKFWLVRGVLFKVEYRSPQKIYYPPDEGYTIEVVKALIPSVAAATSAA